MLPLYFIWRTIYYITRRNFIRKFAKKLYTVTDLIRGWGIYAITIGLLLLSKNRSNFISYILGGCLFASIIWPVFIVTRSGMTPHHKHSLIINGLVLLLVVLLY